jgi:hypothetical protein
VQAVSNNTITAKKKKKKKKKKASQKRNQLFLSHENSIHRSVYCIGTFDGSCIGASTRTSEAHHRRPSFGRACIVRRHIAKCLVLIIVLLLLFLFRNIFCFNALAVAQLRGGQIDPGRAR